MKHKNKPNGLIWAIAIPVMCGILGIFADYFLFKMHQKEKIAELGISYGHPAPVLTIILPIAGFVIFLVIYLIRKITEE